MSNYEQTEDQYIDIVSLLDRIYKGILRFKKIVIIAFVLGAIANCFYTWTSNESTYSSIVSFVVSVDEKTDAYLVTDNSEEIVAAFNKVLSSDAMAEVVQKDLGMSYVPGDIHVSIVPNTNIAEMKVTSSSPDEAYQVAMSIMDNYGQVSKLVMGDVRMVVLDQPIEAVMPDYIPNYFKVAFKGGLFCLAIVIVGIVLYSLLRKTILGEKDVKNILRVPCLAKVPYVVSNRRLTRKESNLLLVNPRIKSGFKQAFHDVRLQIEQDNKKNKHQVFMVSSCLPDEGKSMSATNIAISLAQHGHSVILVDLDLRNPSIFSLTNAENVHGNIVEYLEDVAHLEDVITPQYIENMDVIYGMETQKNATEMLSKPKLEKMLEILRKNYEFVILDVPPLYLMEDAMIVAKQSDAAIVVCKQDHARAHEILENMEELNQYVPSILGVIINQVKSSIFDGEQSSYGYGYGYGYGYKKS